MAPRCAARVTRPMAANFTSRWPGQCAYCPMHFHSCTPVPAPAARPRMVILGTVLTTLAKPMFAASGAVYAGLGTVACLYWITFAKVSQPVVGATPGHAACCRGSVGRGSAQCSNKSPSDIEFHSEIPWIPLLPGRSCLTA